MSERENAWREKVLECRRSGKTAKEWCKENSIPYSTYLSWATKTNKETNTTAEKAPNKAGPQWAAVQLSVSKGENLENKEITLTCGKWTIIVTKTVSVSLLETVLQAVNRVC